MSVADPYGGLFATDPTVNPAYLQLPAAQEQPTLPYSPRGWAQSKLAPPAEEKAMTAPAPEAKKKEGVGFTPEQMLALSKMTGMQELPRMPAAHAAPAPKNQVGNMQQLQLPSGGQANTAPRASLGQIIYGGRKF
jgi:hypothetical protein